MNLGSRWFAGKGLPTFFIRPENAQIFAKAASAGGVSRIVIERPAKIAKVAIYTARPGVVIGKKGGDIETAFRACEYDGN